MAEEAGLIVASVRGSGFGGAMALGRWSGGTVLEHVVAVVRESGLEDLTVVVGPHAEEIVATTDLGSALVVVDYEWEEGSASGLRCGLDAMWRFSAAETAVVFSIDRPGIDAQTVDALLAGHRSGEARVTVPKYRYTHGWPVAVRRVLWPRLMGLEGDVDLLALIEAHRDWLGEVWIDHLAPSVVRSASDLEALAPRG
jgi:molybdenum cofactor cytidylyltransferase